MTPSKLKHLSDIELSYCCDDWHLKSVFLGELFFVTSDKNVWREFYSTYAGYGAFHLNYVDAINYVESNRRKGWSWNIRAIPVIVITEYEKALLIIDYSNHKQFDNFLDFEIEKPNFENTCKYFQSRATVRNYFFIANIKDIHHFHFPLLAQRSISHGGNYELDWEPTFHLMKPHNAIRIVQNISLMLAG